MSRACGYEATCGRPSGHRGHHNGWRSGIAAIVERPVEHVEWWGALGDELTAREMQVVAEYLRHGSFKEAAACLGISPQTAKNYASGAQQRTGATSTPQVAYALGWVRFPDWIDRAHQGRQEQTA